MVVCKQKEFFPFGMVCTTESYFECRSNSSSCVFLLARKCRRCYINPWVVCHNHPCLLLIRTQVSTVSKVSTVQMWTKTENLPNHGFNVTKDASGGKFSLYVIIPVPSQFRSEWGYIHFWTSIVLYAEGVILIYELYAIIITVFFS